jgi:hypothetical protein
LNIAFILFNREDAKDAKIKFFFAFFASFAVKIEACLPSNSVRGGVILIRSIENSLLRFGFIAAEIHEAITDAALRQDVLGIGGVFFQFLAQIVNV